MKNDVCFIYETTNLVNNKKYIGSHIGSIDDNYLGSGRELIKDIKIFGELNFKRDIIEVVPNKDKLGKTEAKWLLAVDAKNNPLYYNKSNTGGPSRYRPLTQKERKLCPMCQRSPVAINYHRFGIVYYKNRCDVCSKAKKKHPIPPKWIRSGYKKKDKCDRCSFKFKLFEQSSVFHVDGDNENVDWTNLKTVCANCSIELVHSKSQWAKSKLAPDY